MSKTSTYTRDLSTTQIKELKEKYSDHLNRSRQGFLSMPVKQRLLKIKKMEREFTNEEKQRYFYDIREHAKSAFGDFLLLMDTLQDSQIKEIFEGNNLSTKEMQQFKQLRNETENKNFFQKLPTFLNMLNTLFIEKGEQDDTWKAYMSYYVITTCTKFLREHDFISTKAHQRLLDEVEDMINVEIARGIYLNREQRVKGFV